MTVHEQEGQVAHRTVSIYDLKKHAANYNTHPQKQLDELKASLKRYGQVEDVVVKQSGVDGSYTIVAGEGITMAALQLLTENTDRWHHLEQWNVTLVPEQWTEVEVRGYMITSNETMRKSTPDKDLLSQLLVEQQQSGKQLLSLATSQDGIEQLLREVRNSHAADFLADIISPPVSVSPPSPSFSGSPDEKGEEAGNGGHPPFPSLPHVGGDAPSPVSAIQEVGEWYPVTYTVTKDQRSVLLEATQKAKTRWGVVTQAEALVHICQTFLEA